MRKLLPLLLVIASQLGACGGRGSDGEPGSDSGADGDGGADVIRTTEVCKVDGDCKMDPGRAFCEEKISVRYEIATCGTDQRCVWSRLEQRCDLRCEDGYCISAAAR